MIKSIFFFTLLIFGSDVYSHSIKLPDDWKRLTIKVLNGNMVSSGFLLNYRGELFAVTNHHAVSPQKTTIQMIINDRVGVRVRRTITVDSTDYISDATNDIAIVPLLGYLDSLGYGFIAESMIGDDSIIQPGREMFVLGFPARQYGRDNFTPLVRAGIISGVTDDKLSFDVDIVGGSSGSPIFISVGTAENPVTFLVGIGHSSFMTPARDSTSTIIPNRYNYFGLGHGTKIGLILKLLDSWFLEGN